MANDIRPATIYDIAKKTNYSAATVSRALNDGVISDKAKEEILRAVKQMKYQPNNAARTLKSKNTKQVLLSIPHLDSAFYYDLIEALNSVISSNGYSLLLQHTHADEQEELSLLRNIQVNNVDALVMISINITERHMTELSRINFPKVISSIGLDILKEGAAAEYDYVGVDTREGLFQATEHLVKQGHTNIGYVGLSPDSHTGQERYSGYESAMQKWGLEIRHENVIFGGYTTAFGYTVGRRLVQSTHMPAAIVTTCDHICFGLYRAFDEFGIRIPEDVALVGMDNIDISTVVKPKLSSVAIASAEIGRKAGELVIARLNGWDAPMQNIVFRPLLVVRESSVNYCKQ